MKLDKIEKTPFKKIVQNFEQNMYRGLIMTSFLATLLYLLPKEWSLFIYFAFFINLVMIAYVVATFKQDITYKSILDMVETKKDTQTEKTETEI